MALQKLRSFIAAQWPSLLLHVAVFGFLAALLTWRLADLTSGYAAVEATTHQASSTLKAIFDNPINAPFTLLNHALLYLNQESLFLARALAAGIGMVVLIVFYLLIYHWHGARPALFGTVLFGTSALFLHTARLGDPAVLSYLLFLLVAAGFWLKQRQSKWAIFVICLLAAMLLYVPGMIFLVIIGAIWQWRVLDAAFKKHLGIVSAGALVFAASIAPLAWALYRQPELIKIWGGLPAGDWPEILTVLKNIAMVPVRVFFRNGPDPVTWLGTAPLLDVFAIGMLAVGVLTYFRSITLRRTQLLIAFFILMAVLIGLGGAVTPVVLLPFLYLLVATGIYCMLSQWLTVFPRNPLARGFGIGLLGVVAALSVSFHLRHYFVGWPQAQATHETFTVQQPPQSVTINQLRE